MIPITAYDFVRLAVAEARFSRPTSTSRPGPEARFVRFRLGLGAAFRSLAGRVEPCHQCVRSISATSTFATARTIDQGGEL